MLLDPAGQGRVHAGHRLIEQQQRGIGHQPAHQLQQAFLAAAEVPGVLIFLGGHADPGHHLPGALHHGPLLRPPVPLAERRLPQRLAPRGRRRDQQIVQYGQRGELTGELKGADDPAPGHLVGGQSGDVLPLVGNRPSARLERTGNNVERGRLPGAVGPDQPGDPAGGDGKRRAVHRVHAAELARQVLNGEPGSGEVAHSPVLTDTTSLAATGKRRRRSGITPRGQNHKKMRASAPTTIHCRASTSPGGPNWGRNRVASRKATGTSSAPTMTPRLLPDPPTMTAVKYTNVSGYSPEPGDQAEMNSTRTAPLMPAITPPRMNASIRSPVTFLPSAAAACSVSRTARIVRASGARVPACTSP